MTPDPAAAEAYVGLGANLGDRARALQAAVDALRGLPGTVAVAASPVYESAAHVLPGGAPQPPYLNAVVRLTTRLAPPALLAALHAVEAAAGRTRAVRWAARPLDLDLLTYGGEQLDRPDLTLPHPRLAGRRFVLAPLADLAPDLVVPGLGRTVADLLAACADAAPTHRTPLRLR